MPKCKKCQKEFIIDNQDKQFYKQIEVPHPTLCPDCRQQRRLAWSDEMTLYQRKCDLTGEDIISMYNPDVSFPIYGVLEWWGDKWNSLDFGVDYDDQKSFLNQLIALKNKVPHPALNITPGTLENSDYVNYVGYAKNCYLIFDSDQNENCYYSYTISFCHDAVDCLKSQRLEFSYHCIDCVNSFKLRYCQDCNKCSESYFLKKCSYCNNCFGCVNLRNKNYCWFNKQLTEEEYKKRLAEIDWGSRQIVKEIEKKINTFVLKYPQIHLHGIRNENCTGDYLYNTFKTLDSYDCWEVQNCRYCYSIPLNAKDMYDVFQFGDGTQLIYEGVVVGYKGYNCKFCYHCFKGCQNIEYCFSCNGCKNCFGCVSLRKKEFCILNKEYSEKEYYKLKEKIVEKMRADGEYGEFFPAEMSHHGYNETTAMFYFPLTREEALKQGFKWYDKEKQATEQKLPPDNIKEIGDDIIKEVFTCSCGKAFKIIPQELKFYKKLNIPLPDKCYICRHVERLKKRNPQHLWERKCDKCGQEIKTTYSPKRPEIVYCKKCFREEVY